MPSHLRDFKFQMTAASQNIYLETVVFLVLNRVLSSDEVHFFLG